MADASQLGNPAENTDPRVLRSRQMLMESLLRLLIRKEFEDISIQEIADEAVTLVRDVPDCFLALANKFWPGGLTLVVEATHRLPLKVTGNTGRVALRLPNCKVPAALIEAVGGPVTGTSANLSGFPSCTNAGQIVKQLGDRLPLILDAGDTGGVLASTIVRIDGDNWTLIREGVIPEEEIQKVLGN